MCGGFVALYSHHQSGRVVPHALYSLGRLSTYLFLGVISAWLGGVVDSATTFVRLTAVLAGVALLVAGISHILFRSRQPSFGSLPRILAGALKPVLGSNSTLKPFAVGVVTTFLPCGWLYSFVALAAASANLVEGALIMTAFWLGTIPTMAGLGFASGWLTRLVAQRRPAVVGLLLILGGILSLASHFQAPARHCYYETSP
jgi:sulfite exporter TauE/SafE